MRHLQIVLANAISPHLSVVAGTSPLCFNEETKQSCVVSILSRG